MMGMYFTTQVGLKNILFSGWNTNSWKDVLLAACITFVLTVIFESLKTLKAYVIIRRRQNSPLSVNESETSADGNEDNSSHADLLSSLRIPLLDATRIRHRKMILFSVESLLHMFNFFYAYILMLLVMTYSIWLLIAVLVGSGAGYFFFNPIGQHLAAKYVSSLMTSSDHPCCSEQETQQCEDPMAEEEPIMAEIT